MPFKWDLRMIMAHRGIWTGADLQRLLEDRTGVRISSAGISRLLQGEQSEVKLIVLDALCVALQCKPSDLIVEQNKRTVLEQQGKAAVNDK